MNKLVEAFDGLIKAVEIYDEASGAYSPLADWDAFKNAKQALAEYSAAPTTPPTDAEIMQCARAMHNAEYTNDLSERDGFIIDGYTEQAKAAIEAFLKMRE